uniref:Mannose receptor, C type 1b n=1 Tax=Maylandia zebra TaxID=106582 RepID=A0A3P9CYI8_9CICH
ITLNHLVVELCYLNKLALATGFCLVKLNNHCNDIRWTSGDRLLVQNKNKCLGVQGKTVGSEVNLYDCDETSELQKWECMNETVIALKGQEFYIDLTADNTAVLSNKVVPNSHLTISGTSSGACTRTYTELYTIEGNAAGRPCMFPFFYKSNWYSECTAVDSPGNRKWCAVETKYDHELWGYCPTNCKYTTNSNTDPTTGASYQLNTQSALTWDQADASCKQQSASLLSISNPHEQEYKLWVGLSFQDLDYVWKWSNGNPYAYLNWDSGKFTFKFQDGFCTAPWIPYNGHCFYLYRNETKKWSDAQKACGKEGGDLVSIRNVEDQSFIISQLGYASTDELWIGLNDRKRERLFVWSDHSPVSYTSWDSQEPTVTSEQEDCVLIRGENGNWADRVCDEKHGFICMKTSDSEPSGDEVELNGWKRHGSYCYFVGIETKTFHEANDDCKSSNSYLADVSTGVDNTFLVSLVGLRPEKHFWIGLSNLKNREYFMWTNNAYARYTHWNTHMPGHVQGCVAMATGHSAGLWDVLPCTNKEKYICKHLAEGAALTPAPPTTATPNCTDGWIKMQSRGICYKIFPEASEKRKTWYEARDYCRAIGGDLVSIHSSADLLRTYNNIYNHWPNQYWIGLSALDPDTGYVWSDRSPVSLQFLTLYNGLCKPVYWDNILLWSDVPCEKYNNWICQIHAGKRTTHMHISYLFSEYNTTSDGWLEWNGAQYYINEKAMAMEDARTFCRQRHGDLVSINSEAERIFLWKQVGNGICKRFTKAMAGFWHDSNCGLEYASFCKRSSSTPTNTTAAVPTVSPKGGCPPPWKKFNSKVRYLSCLLIFLLFTVEGICSQCLEHYIDLFHVSILINGSFRYVDGWHLIFSRWGTNEPRKDRSCVYMDVDGKWKTAHCNETLMSVCMKSTDVLPTESTIFPGVCPQDPEATIENKNYIWVPFRGYCYIFITEQTHWREASTTCTRLCGMLASIEDSSEQKFLEINLRTFQDGFTSFWIGLFKKQYKEEWLWVDRTAMGYTNWAEGQPFNMSFGSRTGEISTSDGTWKDIEIWNYRPYICKTPKGKVIFIYCSVFLFFLFIMLIQIKAKRLQATQRSPDAFLSKYVCLNYHFKRNNNLLP